MELGSLLPALARNSNSSLASKRRVGIGIPNKFGTGVSAALPDGFGSVASSKSLTKPVNDPANKVPCPVAAERNQRVRSLGRTNG